MELQNPDDNIQVIVDSVNYRVHNGSFCICVKVASNGSMTIVPKDQSRDSFVFKGSSPKVVKEIAYLLWKASNLLCEVPDTDQ